MEISPSTVCLSVDSSFQLSRGQGKFPGSVCEPTENVQLIFTTVSSDGTPFNTSWTPSFNVTGEGACLTCLLCMCMCICDSGVAVCLLEGVYTSILIRIQTGVWGMVGVHVHRGHQSHTLMKEDLLKCSRGQFLLQCISNIRILQVTWLSLVFSAQ